MLQAYKTVLETGIDGAPAIPQAVIEYLQTVFSSGYQFRIGSVADLKNQGYSEQYILGYLAGLEAASLLIDQAVDAKVIE